MSSVLMLESFEKCCLNERDKCLLKQSYLAFSAMPKWMPMIKVIQRELSMEK